MLKVYANGLCYCSVCTDLTDREEIELQVNAKNPTGVSSPWRISDDPTFKTGEPNPHLCENDNTCRHFLMEC